MRLMEHQLLSMSDKAHFGKSRRVIASRIVWPGRSPVSLVMDIYNSHRWSYVIARNKYSELIDSFIIFAANR